MCTCVPEADRKLLQIEEQYGKKVADEIRQRIEAKFAEREDAQAAKLEDVESELESILGLPSVTGDENRQLGWGCITGPRG